MRQPGLLGLSPHRHSAKLLPHRHTSYGGLTALLALVGLTLLIVSLAIVAPGNADSSSIDVNGVVPGPPPADAPDITSPTDGAQVSNQQISVSGSCTPSLTVVVTDDQSGRGSTTCDPSGSFSLTISLFSGSNPLAAYQLDDLNQSSPTSATVTVTYQPAGGTSSPATLAGGANPTSAATAGSSASSPAAPAAGVPGQFTVTAPYRFDGIQSGQSFILHGDLEGGTAPYAVHIDWGDRNQMLLSRATAGPFATQHTYTTAGRFTIRLTASDAAGLTTYYQTTAAVGGAVPVKPTTPAKPSTVVPAYKLAIIWPLFLVACLTVFSFWLGELYTRRRERLQPPPTPTAT